MDIVIENLTKKYGDKTIFDNFSVTFPENKISVVMGKSGAGKTTLLNCVAGLTTYRGEIKNADKTAYVFQEDRLVPFMSVYENLDFTLDKSVGKEVRKQLISDAIKSVDLEDKIGSLPKELSGGQKKRVSLARAFLSDASALLTDEPLNSLDYGLRLKTIDLLLDMLDKNPTTVIYVTHDIDEALSLADKIFFIGESGVIFDYEFTTPAKNRDILSESCSLVKRKLIDLFV